MDARGRRSIAGPPEFWNESSIDRSEDEAHDRSHPFPKEHPEGKGEIGQTAADPYRSKNRRSSETRFQDAHLEGRDRAAGQYMVEQCQLQHVRVVTAIQQRLPARGRYVQARREFLLRRRSGSSVAARISGEGTASEIAACLRSQLPGLALGGQSDRARECPLSRRALGCCQIAAVTDSLTNNTRKCPDDRSRICGHVASSRIEHYPPTVIF